MCVYYQPIYEKMLEPSEPFVLKDSIQKVLRVIVSVQLNKVFEADYLLLAQFTDHTVMIDGESKKIEDVLLAEYDAESQSLHMDSPDECKKVYRLLKPALLLSDSEGKQSMKELSLDELDVFFKEYGMHFETSVFDQEYKHLVERVAVYEADSDLFINEIYLGYSVEYDRILACRYSENSQNQPVWTLEVSAEHKIKPDQFKPVTQVYLADHFREDYLHGT